jgi:hypothetical protein
LAILNSFFFCFAMVRNRFHPGSSNNPAFLA